MFLSQWLESPLQGRGSLSVCHPFSTLSPNQQSQVCLCPSVGGFLRVCASQMPLSGGHRAGFPLRVAPRSQWGLTAETSACALALWFLGPRRDGEAGRSPCFCFLLRSICYSSLVLCHKRFWQPSLLIIVNKSPVLLWTLGADHPGGQPPCQLFPLFCSSLSR